MTILEPEVFPNLIGYIERVEVKPLVATTFSLADIVAAQEAFLTNSHVGKIVWGRGRRRVMSVCVQVPPLDINHGLSETCRSLL